MKMEYTFTAHLENRNEDVNGRSWKAITEDRTISFKFDVSDEDAEILMKYNLEDCYRFNDLPRDIRQVFYNVWDIAEAMLLLSEGIPGGVQENGMLVEASYGKMYGKYRILKTRKAKAIAA